MSAALSEMPFDAAPAAAEPVMRTGAELNVATKPYAIEDRAKSWRLLTEVLVLLVGSLVGIAVAPWWPVQLLLAVFVAGLQVRLFIFFHDYLHNAIFVDSKAASAIFSVAGFYMMSVRSVWRETHNYHHKNNAKLVGSAIGSFPVLTIGMWRSIDPGKRRLYRILRHPLTIFFGYFTVFLIGMTISPFRRDAKKHWGGPVAIVLHFGAFALVGATLGWGTAFFMVILPLILSLGAGSYLFFAQHNFPDIKLRDRRSWDYTFAALNSSSYFKMNKVMHWFTGNIGYHHVHHLNHRIPFYRLPEAMAALPELQSPGTTTWRPRDIVANLRLAVWDPEKGRMLTWSEVK